MKKTVFLMLIVALLMGAVSAAAMAKGNCPPGRPDWTGPRGFGFHHKALHLTAAQQQKLLAIRQDFQKETQPFRFEMQKKRLELRQLWTAKPLDQSAIDARTQEVTALRIQLVTKAQGLQDQVKNVLTPDQLKKLKSMKANFRPRMVEKMRHGAGFTGWNFGN